MKRFSTFTEIMSLSDIRKKKEREEKRKRDHGGETRAQRMNRKVYGNMMGGLRKEEVEIDEGVKHDRYMRSHGKKASGSGGWFFTTRAMGEPSDDEIFSGNGRLSDVAKQAQKHFKTKDVYVMEEVELDEGKDGIDQHPEVKKRYDAMRKTKPDSYERRRAVRALTNKKKELRYEKEEAELVENTDKTKYMWKDINAALTSAGINPGTIARVLFNLKGKSTK